MAHERNRDRPRWRRSIFIGNLERNMEQDEMDEAIRSHFEQYGEILTTVVLQSRRFEGQLMGYAFLEFLHRRSCYEALESNEVMFLGRNMLVKMREEPKPRDGG